jgi:hypothetical protein
MAAGRLAGAGTTVDDELRICGVGYRFSVVCCSSPETGKRTTDDAALGAGAVGRTVCEVRIMRAEKRGRAGPSPSNPRGGYYCMPPLALL